MEDIIGPLIFLAILAFSFLNKLRKKPDEDSPSSGENPDVEELPEVIRRMFLGEATPPKARPAQRRDAADDEGWQPVPPPVTIPQPQRRQTPYQPPVARPAAPRAGQSPPERPTQQRPAQQRPIVVQPPTAPRPVARTAAQPRMERDEGPQRRPQPPAQPPAASLPKIPVVKPLRIQAASKAVRQPQQATAQRTPLEKPEATGALIRNMEDVRRGIILQEILGPPVSMR